MVKTMTFGGVQLYNTLPKLIRDESKISLFKFKFKKM